jgi:hypothetical protein
VYPRLGLLSKITLLRLSLLRRAPSSSHQAYKQHLGPRRSDFFFEGTNNVLEAPISDKGDMLYGDLFDHHALLDASGLLESFRKLRAFSDTAQRPAQESQLTVPEEMLEFFMSTGPIAPSADHFVFTGFCQLDGPTAPIALVMAQVDQPVARKRSKCLAERRSLHGQDLSQLTNGWRISRSPFQLREDVKLRDAQASWHHRLII